MIQHLWMIGGGMVRLVYDRPPNVDGGTWTAFVGWTEGVMARASGFGGILESVLEVLGVSAPAVYLFTGV